jgi:2-furoyl-CoA dehydrogenase large subunit
MIAEDAAELVEVDYDPLPPVMTAEDALKDESLVHPEMGTNRNWHGLFEFGEVEKAFKQAAYTIHIGRLHFHRFSSTPLENNAMIAVWDSRSERIEYWSNNSFPAFAAQFLSPALGVRIDQILMKSFDIGGGFGIKITNYPYMAVCALASRKAGDRPVKWAEMNGLSLILVWPSTRMVSLRRLIPDTSTIAAHTRGTSRSAASSGRKCLRAPTVSKTFESI